MQNGLLCGLLDELLGDLLFILTRLFLRPLSNILIVSLLIVTGILQMGCAQEDRYVVEVQNPNENKDLQLYADILRPLLNDPSFMKVTNDLGPTIITQRTFPYKSEVAVAETQPWSSWWFPKKDALLFSVPGGQSALEKYDLVQQTKSNQLPSAAEYEKSTYNPNALPWEGLCDAWALAAIATQEPRKPVRYPMKWGKTVEFSVSDLKALLLKTYEAVDDTNLNFYGQRFTGDAKAWIYPDLFPDQFHRFLEIQLFQKKQAFIMDYDASAAVWNVPVFKANYTMETVPNEPDSIFVRTWVYSAEAVLSHEKEFVGSRVAVREYNYILQGIRNAQGDLVVHTGYWTKGPTGVNSRNDHPDFVLTLEGHLERKTWNPGIDINTVDEILSLSY